MSHMPIQFAVVAAPKRNAVGVFTPALINPDPIRAALERACQGRTDAHVESADWGMFPVDEKATKSDYQFGTCGVIRFLAPLADSDIVQMVAKVVDAMTSNGFVASIV